MTTQPTTRIDGPYTSGVLSLHRKLTHFHNGGWEYQAGDNPLTCKTAQIPPSRLVEDEWRVTPDAPNPPAKPDTPPPPIDWAKTFKGGMSAGGSVHQTSSPHPLDPPEPSEDELRTFCNTIYQRMMTFRYSSAVDLLRGQLAEAREHGRQEVAKRLPRLWGKWDGKGWLSSEHGPALAWSEVAVAMSVLPDWEVREYDPLTGGPKG